MDVEKIVEKLKQGDVKSGVKTWIAKKLFKGDETLMMNTCCTVGILSALILLFCMTNPPEFLISATQRLFEVLGWW